MNQRRADRPDASSVLIDGPWSHHDYSTNGVRLHVAEAGSGPLILLLHGFPQFWWAWRHQIVALADAGYRVVAPDLRGFGASDNPPRKYDVMTTAGDIAQLVTAMGEKEATLVGHDLGGSVAWTVARFRPAVVRRLIVLSAPHPRRWRAALVSDFKQFSASSHVFGFQAPRLPEQRLTHDGAADVGKMMTEWAGERWAATTDFAEARARYQQAMLIPQAAYGAAEHYRWAVRSLPRPDGIRYTRRMSIPVGMPTLQMHGAQDTCVLPTTAQGSGRYVSSAYEWQTISHAGHFLPEEVPDLVTGEILRWIKT